MGDGHDQLSPDPEDSKARGRRLDLALKAAGPGAWEWDINTNRTLWSEENYALLGLPPGDGSATYDDWFARVHPDDRQLAQHAVAIAIEQRGGLDFEYRAVWPDGTEHWIRDVGRMLLDDQGEPIGMYGIQWDTTEKHRLEDGLRRSQKMEAMGHLTGSLAHDFNNLLTVISGYSDMLLDRLSADSDLQAMVGEIVRATERAANLTSQLLAFGRRQVLRPKVIDLNRVVEDMGGLFTTILGESIELVAILQHQLSCVRVDRGQIEQVLLNLTVNAKDAMSAGGRLTMRTSDHAMPPEGSMASADVRYVSLSVEDTGTGIEPELLDHIFDPFCSTKPFGHGSGLGLASVYGIIQQSGGEIDVDTSLGEGTTRTLFLPRHEGSPEASQPPPPPPTVTRGTETILIVEDDAGIRHLIEQALGMTGFQILAAGSAEGAREILAAHEGTIELLLTDVILPGDSGPQLARLVDQQYPSARVLYMSGYGHSVTSHHGILDEGVELLRKPFTIQDLKSKVREILGPRMDDE